MKYYLSLLFICGALSFSFSQPLNRLDFTLGGSVGAESILVIPKIGVNYSYLELDNFNSSVGVEYGVLALLFYQYSVNVYNSFEIKLTPSSSTSKLTTYLLLDNSLGYYEFPNPYQGQQSESFVHSTYTPKIGLSYGVESVIAIYMKVGHSFFLSDNYRDNLAPSDFSSFSNFGSINPTFEAGLRFGFWR